MAVARPFANLSWRHSATACHRSVLFNSSSMGLLTVCLALAMLAGCDKGSTVGASRAVGDAKSASNRTIESEALRQKGGLCDENRRISKPDADRPEWVIWRMYELALGPDDDKSFEAFRQLFPSTRNPRELREMFWNRLRTSVHKMTVEPGKPDFVVCRSIDTDQGRKYYIVTSDPRQSPPPITVGEVEGRNRILFLTPF